MSVVEVKEIMGQVGKQAQSRAEAGPRSRSRPMTEWGPCLLVRGDLPKTHCFKGLMAAAPDPAQQDKHVWPSEGCCAPPTLFITDPRRWTMGRRGV